MEGVDELQSIRKQPVRRGIVRQARRMSLIEEEIDEEFSDVLGVSSGCGRRGRKTERRSSFKEEYYIKWVDLSTVGKEEVAININY